ncbi:amino acid ABC transporter permease [candidate division WOR-3 bacterium]|nr:amino acid ABC transporter permease [candidate division WOR-3 bacterium]
MHYNWDLGLLWEYRRVFLHGAIVTLELTGITILFGTILGTFLGVLLLSRNKIIRGIVVTYVELLRGLPLLVLLVWLYYFLPAFLNIKISAFTTAAFGLSINLSSFVADVVRGAIDGVPTSYKDAARSLGMSSKLILRRIVLPEAFRALIPTLTALYITMFKMSTLASVISVWEPLHSGNSIIIHTYRALEVYTGIAIIYLIIIVPATYFSKKLEKSKYFIRRV